MKFHNEHIQTAFKLISSLSVSHDAVDVVWAAKQQLLMADKDFAQKDKNEKKDEVKSDG